LAEALTARFSVAGAKKKSARAFYMMALSLV
jgi:hypothetical protein